MESLISDLDEPTASDLRDLQTEHHGQVSISNKRQRIMDGKLKLTGLWQSKTKSGEIFYAGNLSPGVRLFVFTNGFKQGDRDPDLLVYLAPARRTEAEQSSHATKVEPVKEHVPF